MPIIGSFSYGSASAIQYSLIEELLTQLPDNTDNIIEAQDIRDSVYTLWERIESVSASVSSTASVFYVNENPTTVSVGGISAGSTFPEPTDMQTMWDRLLYPYVSPNASIGGGGAREYGNPSGVSSYLNLSWSVTRSSEPIISITFTSTPSGTYIGGDGIVPTGENQSGTVPILLTHSVTPGVSQANSYTIRVSDGTGTDSATSTTTWMNKIYWGSVDLGGINLTTNPGLAGNAASICTDNVILNLDGAGVGSGSQLSTSYGKSYDGINGSGNHLIFAWPSNLSGALNPSFRVNGLLNTAFTRIRTASPFVNQYGFTTNYEVWVSNTIQNSPIDTFNIS